MKHVRLGDICSVERQQGRHVNLPYVGLEDIESGSGTFCGPGEPRTVKSTTFRFDTRHVLYGRLRPYLNKVLIPSFHGHCSTEIFPLHPSESLLTRYLFYWLRSGTIVDAINATCRGARMPRANMDEVLELQIPLPPLSEQQRIVAILDQAFENIAKAKANAERNIASSSLLYKLKLEASLSCQASWVTRPLKALTTKIGSGATPKGGQESYVSEGIPLIRSMNVHDGRFKANDLAYLTDEQAQKLAGVTIQEGDVLLNITGASVARCCRAPKEMEGGRVNQHVSILRPRREFLTSRFLELSLIAPSQKRRLLGIGDQGGSTRQAITKSEIEEFQVSFPSEITEQDIIVSELQEHRTMTETLQTMTQSKLSSLASLKQSLLHQAFSGSL